MNQITFYAYSDQVFASRQFTLMFPTADFLQDQTWGAKSNITVPSIEVSFPFNFQQNSSPPSDTKGKQDKDEEELHMYDCPLYRTSLRASSLTSAGHTTNYVTAVNLPSVQPADYWITRGVALLCQLDE